MGEAAYKTGLENGEEKYLELNQNINVTCEKYEDVVITVFGGNVIALNTNQENKRRFK